MTEREGLSFNDQAGSPPPAGDVSEENSTPPSGLLPLQPPSDAQQPRSARQHRWDDASPAAGSPGLSAPSDAGSRAPDRRPDQPGPPHVVASENTTTGIDRSRAAGPDRAAGRGAAPRPVSPQEPPLWRAPGDPSGPPPGFASGHFDPGARDDAAHSPEQQPEGAWSEEGRGFRQAQGSAANWNYLDDLRSSELVPTRRIPPERGWRKAVYRASFKLINLGQSPDERYQAELEAKIQSLLRGTYKIGVLGKGGVGKSTLAASVGSVFAELRLNDRVVAIDADTAFGKLASLIDPTASGSYWELASDRHLFSFGDVRSRVGSNKSGLFVLAGEAATSRRRVLDAAIYREAAMQLDKHFTLSIIDCGSTLDSQVTQEVLTDVDALIVVSSPWYGGASAAGQILEWLANNGFTGLLHRTVVVVNDSDGHSTRRDRALLVERFGKRGQKVIEMPFDEHLRPGGVIDIKNEINRVTRRRLMELAATCAEHFTATADRPRRVR
jgi:MinD-like ATPase involved in chromosome partitioning or flagellar assembly